MSAAAASPVVSSMAELTELPDKLEDLVRAEFDDTCLRRFFFGASFDVYGGTAGLYDYGPVMCSMKANMLSLWRRHFVIEEQMCEVDTPCVTTKDVLVASGHVQRFFDYMVRDTVTGECLRLDKYLGEVFKTRAADKKLSAEERAKYDALSDRSEKVTLEEMKEMLAEHKVVSPKGNALSDPFPFNLMFGTKVGPEGDKEAFMRPELAQGIILNFKRLVDTSNAQRMPFAAACVGQAFRNEIAPRNSLLRVREFTLAEIEHFLNPNNKSHPKFERIAGLKIWAWDMHQQEKNEKPTLRSLGDLVASKTVDNETLGYFIGRTLLFLQKIGARYVRFRQHLKDEKAHYSQDCWDAELLTSYGWCECVGIADRSAYDLTQHMKGSGKDLRARETYAEPRVERIFFRDVVKKVAAKTLAKDIPLLVAYLNNLPVEEAKALATALQAGPQDVTIAEGKTVQITKDMVVLEERDERTTGYDFVPSVIEPSFGVGRILYSVLEQSYWVRRDDTGKNEKRAVFSFTPAIAAQKVAVLPLMMKPAIEPKARALVDDFLAAGVACRTDDSGTAIGRKYARIDELGIPFCVTVDFEEDGCVTLRERDSAKQVRVPIADVVELVAKLSRQHAPMSWDEVAAKYPAQAAAAATA